MNVSLTLATLESHDPHARSGRAERRFLCPFCGDTKPRDAAHRSLSLQTQSGQWICHRCGRCGLLREGNTMVLVPKKRTEENRKIRPSSVTSFAWQPAWEKSVGLRHSPGAAYLAQRGVPVALAQFAGVRYSPRWYGHPAVLFPLWNVQKQLVAVSGRFVQERSAIKTMTGGTKSLGVFSTSALSRATEVAIVEGPLDALSLALCRLPAVALMGTHWPDWLLGAATGKRIFLATDADPPGDAAAARLGEVFSRAGIQALRLRPPFGKDWNDVLVQLGIRRMGRLIKQFLTDSRKVSSFIASGIAE